MTVHPTNPRGFAVLAALMACVSGLAGAVPVISEFMADNQSTLADPSGNRPDWIEIHNPTGQMLNLSGWYLTDDAANLRRWRFPVTQATASLAPGAYLVVFASGAESPPPDGELHAGFSLAAGGEYLALVAPDGVTVVDHFTPEYPPQMTDVSYGTAAGGGMRGFLETPTPGAANSRAIAAPVRFSQASRAFSTAFTLLLSTDPPAATIRYTLDGSVPSASSSVYGGGIEITSTTRVRARAFEAGLADGPVTGEVFYHLQAGPAAFESDLPLVVIDTFGAGDIPHPDDPVRQPCGMMILEPVNGVATLAAGPAVASRAGIRRRGESTLRSTGSKPSLSIETWSEVDEVARPIKPFGMPADSDWILYAPWTIDTAMIRNPFIYEVSNEAGRYAVRTRYVEVFLNTGGGSIADKDYFGLYIFMERIKRDPGRVNVAELPADATSEPEVTGGYIWKKDKFDPDDQIISAAGKDLIGVYPKDMPSAQLNWLAAHINAANAAIQSGGYQSYIDVPSFADHHILNVFANNADGLNFSTFYHKDRNGPIRMGPVWDFDRSMACDNDARASNPEVWSLASDPLFFFHSTGPLWFRRLAFDSPDFWAVWVDRWQAMRKGPLGDAAMAGRIERHRTEIAAAARRNYARWPGVLDAAAWPGKVDVMKSHVLARARWIDNQLVTPPVFSHSGGLVPAGLELAIGGAEARYFTVDGADPRASGGAPAGTAYAAPLAITANTLVKARAWNGKPFVSAPSTWPWSALTEAVFVVDPVPLAITEIMYHPRPPEGAAEAGFLESDFEFIEIRNTGESACDLVGVVLLDGVSFEFTHAGSRTLAAGANGVIVANIDAFKARYPSWHTLNILGEFTGRLENNGERLVLGYDTPDRIVLAEFSYANHWYPLTDGTGFSLVLRNPQGAPSSWNASEAWRHSAAIDGTPGAIEPDPLTTVVHYWNFNQAAGLLEPDRTKGGGAMAAELDGTAEIVAATGQEFSAENARDGDLSGSHLRINNPLGARLTLALPTVGFEGIVVAYETRRSGQGAGLQVIEVTTDGTHYSPFTTIPVLDAPPVIRVLDFSGSPGATDNPRFGLRITFDQGAGGAAGNNRIDNLTVDGTPIDFARWRSLRFANPADAANDAISGPLASPSGDGVPNLIRYAFNRGPYEPVAGLLPVVVDGPDPGIEFRFHFDTDKSDLRWRVLASRDLQDWSHVLHDTAVEGTPPAAPGWHSASVAVPLSLLSGSGSRLFLRLELIQAPPP